MAPRARVSSVKLLVIKKDVICPNHSLHQITCHCNCGQTPVSRTGGQAAGQSVSDGEGWSCVVCCQKVPGPNRKELYAIGPCDHPVCAECCTKMRVLCDQDECPICRQEIAKVMFTSRRDQKYASINFDQIKLSNKDYLIYFENEEAERIFNNLLRHPCRICRSRDLTTNSFSASASPRSWEFKTLKDLDSHLRREHELFLCDLCVDNLKVFSHERKYYSRKDLVRHRKTGDPDDTSHRGHPLCKFCDVRYMDNDDLHRHLRKDHYYCHFCDPLGLNQFYDSYGHLRVHYKAEHFLCEEGLCKEERFTSVFRTDIDLQAHRLQFHCNSRDAKEARILNLDFSLKPRSGPGGGVSAQISASIDHRTRGREGTSYQRGAVGGEIDEEDACNIEATPQPLPKAEDFPSLSQKEGLEVSASSGAGGIAASASSLEGPHASSSTSYTELADKYKDSSQKTKKKGTGNAATFSSRIGGSSFSSERLEDFPALPGFMCPTGSGSAPSRKDLKGQAASSSRYANTLSSVAAAVTSTVPRVVSKVATATCLPTTGNSLMCSSGQGVTAGSKTLSTQSLLSSTSTTSSSTLPAFSVRSTSDFPSLPATDKKNSNKNKGSINAAFSASSESFSHLNIPSSSTMTSCLTGPSGTQKTSLKAVGRQLDFASKLSNPRSNGNNNGKGNTPTSTSSKKSSGKSTTTTGVITLGKGEGTDRGTTGSLSSSKGSEGQKKIYLEDGSRDKIRLSTVSAAASVVAGSGPTTTTDSEEMTKTGTGVSGTSTGNPPSTARLQNKSLPLKNDNEFPGLEPSGAKSTTRISNKAPANTSSKESAKKNPGDKNKTTPTTTSSTGQSRQQQRTSEKDQQKVKQVVNCSSSNRTNNKNNLLTGSSRERTEGKNLNSTNKTGSNNKAGGGLTRTSSSSSGSETEKLNFSGSSNSREASGVKKPPPPPPSTSSVPTSSASSSQKTKSESISLSSVAQVIMGSCGGSGAASSASPSSHHYYSKSLTVNKTNSEGLRDENGNVDSAEGGVTLTSSSSFTDGDGNEKTSKLSSSSCNSNDKEVTSDRFHQQQSIQNTSSQTSKDLVGVGEEVVSRHTSSSSTGLGNNPRPASSSLPDLSSSSLSSTTTEETFLPPSNFEERNLSLVKEVSDILKDHNKFSAFRKVSNDFRKGESRGDEYYRKCIELFGRNNFNKIFNELITLLPNVRKQNELLTAYEKSVKMMSQGSTATTKNSHHNHQSQSGGNSQSGVWILNNPNLADQGLLVCPSCQQVLTRRDGPEHMSFHR